MAKNKIVTLLKNGNRIVVEPTTDKIREALVPLLSYKSNRHLHGAEARRRGLRIETELHQVFILDFKDRIVTSFGMHHRVTDKLKRMGYTVAFKDLHPHPDPEVFKPHWERLFDPRLGINLKPGQDQALIKLLSNQCGRFNCPPGWGKSFLIRLIGTLLPKARIDVTTKRVDVLKERIYPDLCLNLPSVGIICSKQKVFDRRIMCISSGSLHHADGKADIVIADECLTGDTQVLTPGGSTPLSDVKIGSYVMSFDGYNVVPKPVTNFWKKGWKQVLLLQTSDGKTIRCTDNHLIMTKQGWKEAGRLDLDDAVLVSEPVASGRPGTEKSWNRCLSVPVVTSERSLKTIERLPDLEEVFDIEVADCHNFFANGVLVHNCHELAADSYAEKLAVYDNSRMYGMSATNDMRLDNKDMRVEAMFGPILYNMPYEAAQGHGMVVPIEVHWRNVVMDFNPAGEYEESVDRKRAGIWKNTYRNELIAEDARLYDDDTQVLITCETIQHMVQLKRLLPEYELVYAEKGMSALNRRRYVREGLIPHDFPVMTRERRDKLTRDYESGRLKKVICNQVWNVGVNFTELSVLIRADAGGSPTNDVQIPGRASRTHEGKTHATLHDYRDQFDKGFARKAKNRERTYTKQGWTQHYPKNTANSHILDDGDL